MKPEKFNSWLLGGTVGLIGFSMFACAAMETGRVTAWVLAGVALLGSSVCLSIVQNAYQDLHEKLAPADAGEGGVGRG